ncbi:MAG: hypothetical protein IT345_10760 [Trueperaceae bacterium]|nr:hypothetical protein [Trueperaceae bacterium]
MDALCYVAQALTDGELPETFVRAFPTRIVGLLIGSGLWERDDRGIRIHDYLEYQPSRAQVLARRAMRADSGRAGGLASGIVAPVPSKAADIGWDAKWAPFLEAWLKRFDRPPTPKQREMLWPIVDARPTGSAQWVAKASSDAKPFEVVQFILGKWGSLKRD